LLSGPYAPLSLVEGGKFLSSKKYENFSLKNASGGGPILHAQKKFQKI
jgi:hypothetical protein